jgi:16S rRNA (adenine1518-N6/adenine1519-N6)-dimethyltransferase
VMTQREVGERLAAAPGSRTYGLTSVLTAFYAEPKISMRVSRRAFYPVPNVDSVVIDLVRRSPPGQVNADLFSRVARAAFSQRRKTLRNSLTAFIGSPEQAERALIDAGIEPDRRAETLTTWQFATLVRSIGSASGELQPPTDQG